MNRSKWTTLRFALFCLLAAVAVLVTRGPHPEDPRAAPTETGRAGPAAVAAAGAGFRSTARLDEHFQKHGHEFGGIGKDEYLRRAQALRDRVTGPDLLESTRADGVRTRFERGTGAFGAYDPDGTIRTFFRPRDGEAYFRRQARMRER